MQVQNISFGKILYSRRAKAVMPERQFDCLNKISDATNTDLAVISVGKRKEEQSAAIFLDDKRAIMVNAKSGLSIGDILTRIYIYSIVGNLDLLTSRNIVNNEIMQQQEDCEDAERKKLAIDVFASIYAGLVGKGYVISDEQKKFDKADLVGISEEYIRENFPEFARQKDELMQQVEDIRELCKQKDIDVRHSSCIIYDDDFMV